MTSYEMRISDLSSDVCSSDLDGHIDAQFADRQRCVKQRGGAGELPLVLAVLIIGDEPCEGAVEIVMQRRALRGELEAAGDLFDELGDAVAWDEGGEILEIDDLGGDDGRAAECRLRAQSFEIGQARTRSDERRVGKECVSTGRSQGGT